MLESIAGQGASLRQAMPQAPVRLITMVSQGDQANEQLLLWHLCNALQGYGYPPVVLDGTTLESPTQPGLLDLVQDAPWATLGTSAESDWAVMPAAAGLRALGRTRGGPAPVDRLGHLFRGCGVLVVYARSELLIPVLADSGAQPVLAVTPGRQAVVRGYQVFKQFQLQGRLVPTLVSLVTAPLRNADQLARSTARILQKCAMAYLGCQTDVITVRSTPDSARRNDDVHRLALRLLEAGTAPFALAGQAG